MQKTANTTLFFSSYRLSLLSLSLTSQLPSPISRDTTFYAPSSLRPTAPPSMAARPQNIGIKAIEIYFPSQVRRISSAGSWPPRTRRHRCPPSHAPTTHPFTPYNPWARHPQTDTCRITVCGADGTREVRRCRHGEVHHWPRPDEDELLRRPRGSVTPFLFALRFALFIYLLDFSAVVLLALLCRVSQRHSQASNHPTPQFDRDADIAG